MKISEFIGEEYMKKYNDIMPIIRVIVYHLDVGKKGALYYPYGSYYLQRWNIKTIIFLLLGQIKYIFKIIGEILGDFNKNEKVLVSDTIMYIDRYKDFLNEIMQKEEVSAILTRDACGRYCAELLHRRKDSYVKKRQVNLGISIAGTEVKKMVEQVYNLFEELCRNQLRCSDRKEDVENALDNLQLVANKRVRELVEKLKKKNIKLYLTINQLYLDEILIIMACRKAEIWTKEISHYSECVIPISNARQNGYFENNYTANVMMVNESCQWSQHEVVFFEKYRDRTSIYGTDVWLNSVGCPEVTLQLSRELTAKYKKENVIMLMVPSELVYLGAKYRYIVTEETMNILYIERKKLYEEIWKLSQKVGAEVYVRYHPTEHVCYINNERGLLQKYKFKLKESREELYEGLCKSRVVFGMGSPLILANIFGCKVYALSILDEKYDFCGMDIEVVKIKQISHIDLSKARYQKGINEEFCVDIDEVLKVPR